MKITNLTPFFFIWLCAGLLSSVVLHAEMRTWTDDKTGKTVEAELVSKQGRSVILKKSNSKTITIKVSRLVKADQAYIAAKKVPVIKQPAGRLKILAKTVSTRTKRSSWNYAWGAVDQSGITIVANAGKKKVTRRVVGIDLTSPVGSAGGDYVVEMYWFGFPLDKKTRRYICSAVAKSVTVRAGGKTTIAIASDYNYIDEALLYLKSDPYYTEWRGLYVRKWSGYTYAGWVVRISDGSGRIIAQQGAQPSFIRHIANLPIPRKK